MAHTKSTQKRIKQDRKKHLRNMGIKSAVKTTIKRFQDILASGDRKAAKEGLSEVFKSLDKAVTKGVVKKGTADRRKSRLAIQVSKKA